MASVAALVAHQGGWDEVLLVVGPIVVIVATLTLAKRRVDRLERAGLDADAASATGGGTGRHDIADDRLAPGSGA